MMKNYIFKFQFLFILFASMTSSASAQNTDMANATITWSSSSFIDNNGESVNDETYLITNTDNIIWRQKGIDQILEVVDRDWNWNEESGHITHQVLINSIQGNVSISGSGNDIEAFISLVVNGVEQSFTLSISSYTYD